MSKKETIKTVSLNIMLLKAGCNLNNRYVYIDEYSENNVIRGGNNSDNYFLYKNGHSGNKPAWVEEFDEKIWNAEIKNEFSNTATEGLSVIKKVSYNNQDYLFAINFGQGRYNIIKEKIEDTFGIYTAIALIEKGASIRRAGTRNISSNPKNTEYQHAQELSKDAFNAELEDNDIIRHLNAIADSPTISSVIGKYGSLNIRMRFKETEIPCWDYLDDRLKDLINLFEDIQNNSDVVNKFFKGLRPLPSQKQNELNNAIINKINDKHSEFFLFEPEIDYDTTLISKTRYKIQSEPKAVYENEKLSLTYYLSLKENLEELDFINDKIILINEDGQKYKEWSIIKCLYGEMKIDDQVYILSNSIWYGLPKDKYDHINENINSIEDNIQISETVKINTMNKILEEKKLSREHINKERIFNNEFCNQISGELFDQINKQIIIDGDKMEICDIFDPNNKEFIHTKIGTKAATLSHLFNQGYVSARAYASMKHIFVPRVNEKIENSEHKIEGERNSHQNYTVRYLIINEKADNKLTFISKLALDRIITDLKGFGYNIKLSWVNGINLDPVVEN